MTCNPYVTAFHDVENGLTYQAACPRCKWEGDPTANDTVARIQMKKHTEEQGENE